MFELPNEDSLRQTTSYTDIFMFTLMYNIGIYGIFAFALFLFFLIIKLYHLRKKKIEESHKRQSLLTYQASNRGSQSISRVSHTQEQYREDTHIEVAQQNQNTTNLMEENIIIPRQSKITLFKVINFLTSLFFYLVLVVLSFLYLSIYIFGFMGRGTGHDIVAAAIMFGIILIPTILWKVKTRERQISFKKSQAIVTVVLLVLWAGVCITSVLLLKGVCICVFNSNYGFKIQDQFVFSTEFMRSQSIQQVCKSGSVCHLYATLTEETSTEVIINAHTGIDVENLNITLRVANQTFLSTQNMTVTLSNVEYIAQRNVFSFYFKGLTPNTLYNVSVINQQTKAILNETTYLTLPDRSSSQIRFAVGGDVGLDQDAITLTSYLVKYNPHVLLIGGDIAYDDGMSTCFYSWDNFYDIFEGLNRNLTRIVPMVLTIGNHDVGFDALSLASKQYTNIDNTPYFFVFNPQQIANGKIPEFNKRSAYHTHKIGPTVHVHLDSGYINTYSSQQNLIKYINTQYKNFYKFANYHNPLYPSCTVNQTNSNDMNVITNGTQYWTPHFDNGSFTAIFEHHTHHRKFTKKIKGDKPVQDNQQGVRYIGDGSWGVPEGGCGVHRQTKRPQYFEYMDHGQPNHIWLITLKSKSLALHEINYTAININNTVVYNKTDTLILPL